MLYFGSNVSISIYKNIFINGLNHVDRLSSNTEKNDELGT